MVRKTSQSKPWVVHVDKLKAFRGEIPKQWRDIEKGRPAVSDDVVEPQRQNAEDVENQAIAGRNSPTEGGNNPTAGCDRPKRTVYAPRYLSDYKTEVVSELMPNMADADDLGVGLLVCDLLKGTEACGMAFEMESGIRKHMLREHNAKSPSIAAVVATNCCLVTS